MIVARSVRVVSAFFAALAMLPVGAQEPVKAKSDTKVVLRISRDFIVKLTRKQFEQDEPIHTSAMGAIVDGSAHVAANVDVKLHRSPTESDFDLLVNGDIMTQTVVTRRPVRIVMHGAGPFQASRRVVFDGHTFSAQAVAVGVCYQSGVDDIGTLRGGLAAPLIRRFARPIVMRSLPEGDQTADQDIRSQVGTKIAEETDKVVGVLNEIVALRKHAIDKLGELGIKLAHPNVAFAATEDVLLTGIGFPEGQPLTFPTAAGPPKAPVELWVYHKLANLPLLATVLEASLKVEWARIKPRIQKRIETHSPDVAQRLGDVTEKFELHPVRTEPDWHVLRFSRQIHASEPKAS